MGRIAVRVVITLALLVVGWSVGKAQTTTGDFSVTVDAPSGAVNIECVRGCTLQGGRDAGNPNNRPVPKYTFSCSAPRCSTTVNGFLAK